MGIGSGLQRAQSFLLLATGLYRISHLAVGLVGLAHGRSGGRPVGWLLMATAVGCTVLVFGAARSHGWLRAPHVVADVVLVGCALPFAAYFWAGMRETPAIGWAMLLGGSSSGLAAIGLTRWPAAAAVLAIAAIHVVGYRMTGAGVAVIGAHTNAVLSSAAITWLLWRYVRRQGTLLDAANELAVTAEAGRVRYAERIAHHRALHDTVLATLTTIARGGVDANSDPVRSRCAREAAYLRRLIQRSAEEEGPAPGLAAALEGAVRAAEDLELKVTARYHDLPSVPPEVVSALADAVAEALNNVQRHARTGRAFLTAARHGDGVLVTVVDRGAGFAPGAVAAGHVGLAQSVHARMREAGGFAEVDSAPGEGTVVELRWPR